MTSERIGNTVFLQPHTLGFVTLVDSMGDDLRVVNSARVSHGASDAGERTDADNKRLIRYLLKNRHTSPLEHVQFTFMVECPIFVARQWMRHRTWSFNEVSARYAEVDSDYYAPDVWRSQSDSNKQASGAPLPQDIQDMAMDVYDAAAETAFGAYQMMIEAGVAREQARMVLPVSTLTRFYASVDLHNLLHFISLRDHPHAQIEIRVFAQAMKDLARDVVPWTIGIWEDLNG